MGRKKEELQPRLALGPEEVYKNSYFLAPLLSADPKRGVATLDTESGPLSVLVGRRAAVMLERVLGEAEDETLHVASIPIQGKPFRFVLAVVSAGEEATGEKIVDWMNRVFLAEYGEECVGVTGTPEKWRSLRILVKTGDKRPETRILTALSVWKHTEGFIKGGGRGGRLKKGLPLGVPGKPYRAMIRRDVLPDRVDELERFKKF